MQVWSTQNRKLNMQTQCNHTIRSGIFHNYYPKFGCEECSWSWSSSCGRQTVDQFIWVSGLPLGPLTRFYLTLFFSADKYLILLSKASSLTRKRVCSLQCNLSLVPITMLTVSSETVFSYDSQGLRWKYSNPPPHGVRNVCQSHIATDGQSVSMSWCRAQIWDFWPEIIFVYFYFFWKLQSCHFWGALSDERSGLSCVSLCLWSLQ
jgi:hypothetical protein